MMVTFHGHVHLMDNHVYADAQSDLRICCSFASKSGFSRIGRYFLVDPTT